MALGDTRVGNEACVRCISSIQTIHHRTGPTVWGNGLADYLGYFTGANSSNAGWADLFGQYTQRFANVFLPLASKPPTMKLMTANPMCQHPAKTEGFFFFFNHRAI